MEFLKLILYIGLIFATAMTVCTSKNAINDIIVDLPHDIISRQYYVRLITDIQESYVNFHGECNVTMEIRTATYSIKLLLLEMKIDESATKLLNIISNVIYIPNNCIYGEESVLIFDEMLLPGWYILYMKYSGNSPVNQPRKINHLQLTSYVSKEGGRMWLAVMPFVLISIVGWDFSCWGRPAIRHFCTISVKHDRSFRALSNTPIRLQYMDEDGTMWTEFNMTPLMPICLAAVVLTDFVRVRDESETVNVWGRSHLVPSMTHAQSVAEKVKEYMAEYADVPEKILKIDHVAIPNFSFRGLSLWGLNLYSESNIIYDHRKDFSFRQRYVAKVITHEVSHQWFGNLVTPASLFYRWLNEGLASFYESYILDKIYERWRMMDLLVIDQLHGSLSEDTGYIMNSIEPQTSDDSSDTFKYVPIYNKAPVILRMLQHIITEKVFQNGIVIYLKTPEFESATSDDLWIAMQAALDESDVPYFEVKTVMNTWINQVHYPLVTVTRNYETGETLISQEHFHLQDVGNDNKWWIPVTWTTQTNLDFSDTVPTHWSSPSTPNIRLMIDPNDWIIVNLQQTGYYRVNYDSMNWWKIAQYLNSENYTKVHVLNRAQIIDDACALLMAKHLDIFIFFELTRYLSRETDYIVWYPMFQALTQLLKFFSLPESEAFKLHMTNIFNELLKNIGFEEEPDEDDFIKLNRLEVMKWAQIISARK